MVEHHVVNDSLRYKHSIRIYVFDALTITLYSRGELGHPVFAWNPSAHEIHHIWKHSQDNQIGNKLTLHPTKVPGFTIPLNKTKQQIISVRLTRVFRKTNCQLHSSEIPRTKLEIQEPTDFLLINKDIIIMHISVDQLAWNLVLYKLAYLFLHFQNPRRQKLCPFSYIVESLRF